MSYLYGRATKAVSICPPAYYADLVCTRARVLNSNFYDDNASSHDGDDKGEAKKGDPKKGAPKKDDDKKKDPTMAITEVNEKLRNTMYYI
jgi:hypothetical protein